MDQNSGHVAFNSDGHVVCISGGKHAEHGAGYIQKH